MSATRIDEELRTTIAINMGLYYRKSDNKWLREKHSNGKYIGVDDMTPELDSVMQVFTKAQHQLLDELIESLPEKLDLPSYDNAYAEYKLTKGFNGAVEKITEVLEKKRATLQGGE